MDGSFDVEAWLQIARKLLLELVNMGLPLATEALDPNSPANAWAICLAGEQLVLKCDDRKLTVKWPPGFPCRLVLKTAPDGSLATAINAMRTSHQPHRFVGINQAGQVALLQSWGSPPAM